MLFTCISYRENGDTRNKVTFYDLEMFYRGLKYATWLEKARSIVITDEKDIIWLEYTKPPAIEDGQGYERVYYRGKSAPDGLGFTFQDINDALRSCVAMFRNEWEGIDLALSMRGKLTKKTYLYMRLK